MLSADDRTAEMKRLYVEGLTVHEIGARLGISGATVAQELRTAGITMRARGRKPLFPTDQKCTQCKTVKPIEEFERDARRACGYGHTCKACRKSYAAANLHRRYGLSKEAFSELIAKQGLQCAICGVTPEEVALGKHKKLCIDHDHTTGLVRGLLCSNCNTAIGMLKDDLERLRRAIAYLGG